MQEEYFGFGTINNLSNLIEKNNIKNIFLVSGKKSFDLSGAKAKIEPILKNINYTHFSQFSSNPDIKEVKKGISIFKKVNPDAVVAVGGGSVLDIAKAINVLSFQKKDPEEYLKGKSKLEKPGKTLIAIPATSGTGSEATRFSTIYIDKTKHSLSHESYTIPNIAIIDPSLTESMPKYLTAVTGLDALCQAIESLWAVGSTKESEKIAEQALKIAYKSLSSAVNGPDKESRNNMAKAANLSGKAINISKTTACHSISYPITSFFGVAHGHAVALSMPEIIEFNSKIDENSCIDKRGVDFVRSQVNKVISIMECKNGADAKESFNNLMDDIGIQRSLSKLNIDRTGIKKIIENGFTPDRMNNNPRKITKEDLEKIMDRIL